MLKFVLIESKVKNKKKLFLNISYFFLLLIKTIYKKKRIIQNFYFPIIKLSTKYHILFIFYVLSIKLNEPFTNTTCNQISLSIIRSYENFNVIYRQLYAIYDKVIQLLAMTIYYYLLKITILNCITICNFVDCCFLK